ncbi:hypothetical protein EPIB1_1019 [Tritonibacter mobilis]|nr:hypothetical protein EPIB1_1019 [Tritonibacter mobilis]
MNFLRNSRKMPQCGKNQHPTFDEGALSSSSYKYLGEREGQRPSH